MSVQSLSFKDHVAGMVNEYEKLEQHVKLLLHENGSLRDRLRASSGSGVFSSLWAGGSTVSSLLVDSGDGSPNSAALQHLKNGGSECLTGRRSVEEVILAEGEQEESDSSQKLTGDWDLVEKQPVDLGSDERPAAVPVPATVAPTRSLRSTLEHDPGRGISNRSLPTLQELLERGGCSQTFDLKGSFRSQKDPLDNFDSSISSRQAHEMLEYGRRSKSSGGHSRDHSISSRTEFADEPPEVWSEWALEVASAEQLMLSPSERYRLHSVPHGLRRICGEAMLDHNSCVQHLVMRPNSFYRGIWDFTSMVVLSFDIISIPLEVFNFSHDQKSSSTTSVSEYMLTSMEWFTTCFWTGDILMSFLTGFHSEGLIEMRPSVIARRYLNNGFCLDMTVVGVDWILAIFTFQVKAVVRVGKTARVLRLVRMVRAMRLIRSVKIARLLTSLFAYIKSDLLRTLASILLMLVVLVVANHYIACGWYLMGTVSSYGWLQHNDLIPADDEYIYVTALHWSLTQFTPASMEVYPCNLHERIYTVCVLLFALVTFSSFVSGITNGMMYLRKLKTEPAQQEAILRQYFQESRISAELGQRIWKFLHVNHFQNRKKIHRSDLAILKLVPESLRNKLSEELYLPVVTWNPFFRRFGSLHGIELNEICHHAVTEKCLTTREELFLENKVAEKMSFITMGIMDYRHRVVTLCDAVTSGSWACEPVLWMNWTHCGRLAARTSCEIIQVQAKSFRNIVAKERLAHLYASSYAKFFRSFIMSNANLWYSDIWAHTPEYDELLQCWEDENPYLCEDMSSMRNTTCSSDRGNSEANSQSVPPAIVRIAQRMGLLPKDPVRRNSCASSNGGC